MFKQHYKKHLGNTQLAETLTDFAAKPKNGITKIHEMLSEFQENGLLLIMIFFSLPIAIPLPYPPGFTTFMGLPLMALSLQMLFGYRQVRLPKIINNYEVKNSLLIMLSNKVLPLLIKAEQYIKPRFSFATSTYCEQFIGFVSLIASFAVAIPIPFTNAIPALGIFLMTLGLLNRDGLVIMIGFIITIIGMVIAIGILLTSWVGIKYVLHLIF